jgi:hypothetical protein
LKLSKREKTKVYRIINQITEASIKNKAEQHFNKNNGKEAIFEDAGVSNDNGTEKSKGLSK